MSKKSRRTRKTPSRSLPQVAAETAATAAVVEPAADQHEYAYVVANLKRVAVLAAAMFALLVGLSFFIG